VTVAELHAELSRLVAAGHGAKAVGLPEGFHGSGDGTGERVTFTVEENDTLEDGHPGFVWVAVEASPPAR
jgi:hypothetical protein